MNNQIEEPRRIAGSGSVITDTEKLEAYSHNETDAAEYGSIVISREKMNRLIRSHRL